MVTPKSKKSILEYLQTKHNLSQRRSCQLLDLSRSVAQYDCKTPSPQKLIDRLLELAIERPRFGYRRLHVMLCREGRQINHKRVFRIYSLLGLQVRRKKRRQISRASRKPHILPTKVNDTWSMDFMSDTLFDGRGIRVFNVVDNLSREAVAMTLDFSLPASRVIRSLDEAIEVRGKPQRILMDNGPEFTGNALDAWAYKNGIELHFIAPGKPTENAFAESFNSRVREECLNQHCFSSMAEAREIIADWQRDYNTVRPHSSLKYLTPQEFVDNLEEGYPSSNPVRVIPCVSLTQTTLT